MCEKFGVDYPLKAVVDSERRCHVTGVSTNAGISPQDDRLQLTTLNG